MDFTREPIIETVITPKEGCTLVVRSSKSSGQEEYFVDAIEVVIFGNAIFFRSRERPKAFLVPASDYEVLEVRETRLVLKNVGLDRSIKIAGGREAPLRHGRDIPGPKLERLASPLEKTVALASPPQGASAAETPEEVAPAEGRPDVRLDKKRDRRRSYRRRRGKDEDAAKGVEEGEVSENQVADTGAVELPAPHLSQEEIASSTASAPVAVVLSSLLAPPPNLISETIARYKDNALFKGAFFLKDEDEDEANLTSDVQVESNEVSVESEGVDEMHSTHLTETLFDPEGVEVSTMSLDYPVYGSVEPLASPEVISSKVAASLESKEQVFQPTDEPFFSEQITEGSISESVLENVYPSKEVLEEERLNAEEAIAIGSVAAEVQIVGENIELQGVEEALKESINLEKDLDEHATDPL